MRDMSWSPEQFGEFDEDDINLDLQFDAPQWEDLEKEKQLQEQGITIDSNLHDDWFRQVHPLHEAKLEMNKQGKGVVDRKGNKLSLDMSKSGPRLRSMEFDNKSGARKPVPNGTTSVGTRQRKCWDLSGSKVNSISPRVTQEKQGCTSRTRSSDSTDDMDKEIRAMLEAHNRRIMKQKAEYDENGRKIRKGTPETCHAPSLKETQNQAKLKNKRRSVNLSRPEIPKEAKQKRRSCFTLSTVEESSPKPAKIVPASTTTTTTTTTAVYGYQTRSTLSKNKVLANTTSLTNHNKQNTLSRQRSLRTMDKPTINRQRNIEKRKSSQASDAEQEIKDLIAQHNLKVAAKAKNKQK